LYLQMSYYHLFIVSRRINTPAKDISTVKNAGLAVFSQFWSILPLAKILLAIFVLTSYNCAG